MSDNENQVKEDISVLEEKIQRLSEYYSDRPIDAAAGHEIDETLRRYNELCRMEEDRKNQGMP